MNLKNWVQAQYSPAHPIERWDSTSSVRSPYGFCHKSVEVSQSTHWVTEFRGRKRYPAIEVSITKPFNINTKFQTEIIIYKTS